jgi:predicted ATPase/DNA-binding SARP family transcriptional activator
MLRIRALGMFEVTADGVSLTAQLSPTQKALITYLGWTGCMQERSHLAEFLWPERSASRSLSNLRTVLSQLRKVIGPYLHTTHTGVGLDKGDNVWLDAAFVRQALDAVPGHRPDTSLTLPHLSQMESALSLYTGTLLAGFPHVESLLWEEWLDQQRRSIEGRIIVALAQLGQHYYAQEEYTRAAHFFTRLTQLSPYDEEAYSQLLSALTLAGQPGLALSVYDQYCMMLQQDFGELNSGEALATLARRIRTGEIRSAYQEASKASTSLSPSRIRKRATVPQLIKPLLAREAELQTLIDHVRRGRRLISVVGMGGIGKTHLLTAAFRHLRHFFEDGVYYIDLSSVQNTTLAGSESDAQHQLVLSMAAGLDLFFDTQEDEATQLLDFLAQRQLCLILDNFETVIAAAPLVAQILSESTITVVTGSRIRLKLSNEILLPLEGIPYQKQNEGEEGTINGAVSLFVDAAQRSCPHFRLTESNSAAVARIAQQVGGLPLALELAASWVEHFSPEEISRQIDQSLSFLTTSAADLPERQRRLDGLLSQSAALLAENETQLLTSLSYFASPFSRSAALTVGNGTLSTLVELVNKQWVQTTSEGAYFLHPLVKRFAQEGLSESKDETARWKTAQRHADFFVAYAKERLTSEEASHETGPHYANALNELRSVHSDLCTAIKWQLEHQPHNALDLVCMLQPYWENFGILSEAATWLDQCLKRYNIPDSRMTRCLALAMQWIRRQPNLGPLQVWFEKSFELLNQLDCPVELAELCHLLSWHTFNRQPNPWQERGVRGAHYMEQAVSLYRLLGQNDGAIDALLDQAYMQLWTPQPERAEEILCEAEIRAGDNPSPRQRAMLAYRRAAQAYFQRRWWAAWAFAENALLWAEKATIGEEMLAWFHKLSADIAWHLGDFDHAWAHGQRGDAIFRQFAHYTGLADLQFRLGMTAEQRGDKTAAIAHFVDCIEFSRTVQFNGNLSAGFIGLGLNHCRSGQPETGAQFIGYGAKCLAEHGGMLLPWDKESIEKLLSTAREEVKQRDVETFFAEGKLLSTTAAFDLIGLPTHGRYRPTLHKKEAPLPEQPVEQRAAKRKHRRRLSSHTTDFAAKRK